MPPSKLTGASNSRENHQGFENNQGDNLIKNFIETFCLREWDWWHSLVIKSKKSQGVDAISINVIKHCKDYLLKSFINVINNSFSNGVSPNS